MRTSPLSVLCLTLLLAGPTFAQQTVDPATAPAAAADAGLAVVPLATPPAPPARSAPFTESANPTTEARAQRIEVPALAGFDFRFMGYFWVDTGYMSRTNAQQGQYDQSNAYMQGRFVLGTSVTRGFGDYYATAKVEFIGFVNEFAHSQYEPHTLDAYVRVGHQKWWDLQVGRFLAWEVYHRGQGIEWWTAEEAGALGAPALYWLEQAQGYRNESGQAAVHFYPFDLLKFEVAGVYGQENNQNDFGVRPVAIFTWKGLQLAAGYELLAARPQTSADKVRTTTQGFAGRVQYTFFDHVTAGVNFGQAYVNATDINGDVDSSKTLDKYSVGGFVDIDFWKNSIGLGYHYTNQLNHRQENNTHQQAFVSYTLRLPITGLSVKAVYGFALGHIEDADAKATWQNSVHSVRVRLSYEFN